MNLILSHTKSMHELIFSTKEQSVSPTLKTGESFELMAAKRKVLLQLWDTR